MCVRDAERGAKRKQVPNGGTYCCAASRCVECETRASERACEALGRDSSSNRPSGAAAITTDHPRGAGFDPVFSMLTDMSPSAGAQFYSTQIPAMGMNITNIATHMQKPSDV
uniref:Uncharacterized protein n=1 Tax=Anopheles merus TaxID=30066 RepID=A0A182V0P6_ANOME